jgi:hypothetical protein
MSTVRLLAITLLLLAWSASAAEGREAVKLHTDFQPDRLGASTTIDFGLVVTNPTGGVPAPVTRVDLHFPAGMNPNTSELGLGICQPAALMLQGPEGCPGNSRVGFGTAFVEVAVGKTLIQESASITTFFGPPKTTNEVLFYASGNTPVDAELVFPGQLKSEKIGIYGGELETNVPLVESWPGGPDVALTRFESTIGPSHLTYYIHSHGKTEAFHPQGIAVPTTCPHKGFPFAAELAFTDGTEVTATHRVPCPGRRPHRRR